MRHGNMTAICILLVLMLAGFGLAEDQGLEQGVDAAEHAQMAARLATYLGPRIDLLSESVARRCQFGQAPDLRASVERALVKVEVADILKKDGSVRWAPLLETVLGEYLSEAQLQDYLAVAQARESRDALAAAGQMIACADQHLSLATGQREDAVLIFASLLADEGMTSRALLNMDAHEIMGLSARLARDLNPWQGVLSASQVRVWALMTVETSKRAGQDIAPKKKVLWADPTVRPEHEAPGWEERARLIIAAKLAAHTEQLGELDARAAKRLALVAKGVVEQVMESQDMNQWENPTHARHAAGRLIRDPDEERLEKIRGWGGDQNEDQEQGPNSAINCLNHPLYQQTIKDVLSEDAYARYQASRAQRAAFQHQAHRDLVVAYLDTRLLLDEAQCVRLEERLVEYPASKTTHAWVLRTWLVKQMDQKDLGQWQRRELDVSLRERGRWGG
jgi:hypothetical protein